MTNVEKITIIQWKAEQLGLIKYTNLKPTEAEIEQYAAEYKAFKEQEMKYMKEHKQLK